MQVGGQNVSAGTPAQLLISLGGVIQQPTTDYTVSTSSLTFVTAPASGLSFFAILMGDALSVGTPSDGTVSTAKLASGLTVDLTSGSVGAPSLTFDANTGLYSPAEDEIGFVEGGVEAARIDSSGRLLVGTTTSPSSSVSGAQLSNPITEACKFSSGSTTSAVNQIAFINGNGTVGTISTSGSSTAYNTSSDYRLKENVVVLDGAIDRLKLLPIHRFNFIADPDTVVDGFIAHEAAEVVPECVTGTKDELDEDGNPVYQGIDQSKLVPLLTAALKEAIKEIEALKVRLDAANL